MLSKTLAHHNKTMHIDTNYHFIRDCIEDGRVIIEQVKTENQLADILTKALGRVKFGEQSARIGVKKAWDEKKIKEENVGSDFSTQCTDGTRGTAVARRGEHPVCTQGVHSAGTVAPTKMVPHGAQWRVEYVGASASALSIAPNSASTVALADLAHAWRSRFRRTLRADKHIPAISVAPAEMCATCMAQLMEIIDFHTPRGALDGIVAHENLRDPFFKFFSL